MFHDQLQLINHTGCISAIIREEYPSALLNYISGALEHILSPCSLVHHIVYVCGGVHWLELRPDITERIYDEALFSSYGDS